MLYISLCPEDCTDDEDWLLERPDPKSGPLPFLDPIRQPLSKIYKWRWIIYIEHSFAFINLYFTTNLASGLWCNRQAASTPSQQSNQSRVLKALVWQRLEAATFTVSFT